VKVIQILLVVCLALTLVFVGCQGKTAQYSTATPEGTIKLLLGAHENLDVNKATELFVKEDREKIHSHLSQLWGQQESVAYSEIEIKVMSQTENTAKVKVEGEVIIAEKDMPSQRMGIGDEFNLVKQGSEWLIKAPPDL